MKRLTAVLAIAYTMTLSAYPLGLDPIGPVQSSGSDAQSQAYNSFAQSISYITSSNYAFNPSYIPNAQVVSDPANILSNSDANVRIYYAGGTSALNDTLGFSSSGSLYSNASLIFSNASGSSANPNNNNSYAYYPSLAKGSFVDLGVLSQGTPFDLFLAGNAAESFNYNTVWTNNALNPYGASQVKVVHFLGTDYYLIGFEEQAYGSDYDYNDVYIVAEITSVPEPMTYVIFAVLGMVVLALSRDKTRGTKKSDI